VHRQGACDRYRKGKRHAGRDVRALRRAGLDGAHDASSDAVAAARLAWVLASRGEVVRREPQSSYEAHEVTELRALWSAARDDLQVLHRAQVEWAYEQAVSLAEHFRKQGDPAADGVQTDWPVVPAGAALAA
jgi:DNA polymerase-3 subunit epsilon